MKRQLAILGLLACLITSTAASSVLMSDSKVIENRSMLVKENSSKIICLNFSNFSDNEVHEYVDNKTNDRNNSYFNISVSNSTNDKNNNSYMERTDTITIYAYPSSWRDSDYPYRLYKTVWDDSILNICSNNKKCTKEGEWTRFSDDTDYSQVTGYEKDFHGLSVRKYLISVEPV